MQSGSSGNDPSGGQPDCNDGNKTNDDSARMAQQREGKKYGHPAKHYARVAYRALTLIWRESPNANQILALATIILVIIGWYAIRLTEKTLELSERAWVGPRDAKFAGSLSANNAAEISIEYQNTGREPALSFIYDTRIVVGTPQDFDNGKLGREIAADVVRCRALDDRENIGSMVFPTTGFSSYTLNVAVAKEFIDDAVLKGDKILFLQGCFVYLTFETPRHTAFCYYFKGGQTKPEHLNICPGGMGAD